jgi:hypothetical protein
MCTRQATTYIYKTSYDCLRLLSCCQCVMLAGSATRRWVSKNCKKLPISTLCENLANLYSIPRAVSPKPPIIQIAPGLLTNAATGVNASHDAVKTDANASSSCRTHENSLSIEPFAANFKFFKLFMSLEAVQRLTRMYMTHVQHSNVLEALLLLQSSNVRCYSGICLYCAVVLCV